MKKEKYYTPTIEEFGINFEYQYFKSNGAGDFWLDDKITFFSELCGDGGVEERLSDGKIRVKYLDREDIESFEFIEDEKSKGFFLHKEERFFVSFDYWLNKSDYSFMNVKVGDEQNEYDFAGIIKNKSEFSRLLKQLSII